MTTTPAPHLGIRRQIETPGALNHKPEFIRLPKPGTLCQWTGLSRSKLNELILPSPVNSYRPPVRSISLRNRGQVKAVRLIVLDSLISYLRSLEDSQPVEFGDQQNAETPNSLTPPTSSRNQACYKPADAISERSLRSGPQASKRPVAKAA
jgi:hypothetical protein